MIDFKKELNKFTFLQVASDLAAESSVELYLVGGFVRDIILQRTKTEMDFLVVGSGIDFATLLAKKLHIKNVTTYKNFGTAHFNFNGFDLEFVGARKESYNRNSRNPIVEDGSFEEDIERRDFTVNALAVSLNKEDFGKLIDRYNGFEDIEKKIIKTPLNPMDTFNDDPLRILRAFRFVAQLDFDVDDSVLLAAEKLAERLKIISIERITDEFLKILAGLNPSKALILLHKVNVLKVIFPELHNLAGTEQIKEYHHKDVFFHTMEVLDNICPNTKNVWLRFAALMHDVAKPITKKFDEKIGWTFHGHEEIGARMMKPIFKRFKFPFSQLEYVQKLIRLHLRPIALVDEIVTDSAVRRFIVKAGEDLDDLITLCRADITSKNQAKVSRYLQNYDLVMQKVKEVEEKDKLRAFQSPVRGDEIMKICNIPPGKTVGLIKSAIEDAILDGIIPNTYEAAFEYLMKIKDDFLN